MSDPTPYNPLAKENLADSTVAKLLLRPALPLPPHSFEGAGVYAIYYTGNFTAYSKIADANREGRFGCPIYVGKAIPSGGRKGGNGLDTDPGTALVKRLREHAKSIKAAPNLDINDFHVRWLCVDEVFIALGENMLISRFRPVWNLVIEGFGNHAVGKGRNEGAKPSWDVLHPGRTWADRLQALTTIPDLEARIIQHFPDIP